MQLWATCLPLLQDLLIYADTLQLVRQINRPWNKTLSCITLLVTVHVVANAVLWLDNRDPGVDAGDLVTVSKTLYIPTLAGQESSRMLPPRRSLLDTTSAALGQSASPTVEGIWESTSINSSVPIRHVTPENQLVSGFFVHQTRKPSYSICDRFFASKLAHPCLLQKLAGPLNAGSFARTATDPYGTDPVFNSLSSIYDSQTAQNVWQYYNASAAAGEVAATGTPYGFFSREAKGYSKGFPITFPVCHCYLMCARISESTVHQACGHVCGCLLLCI